MKVEHSGPKLMPADITIFEQEIGSSLPDDYRNFLLKHNGGVPRPNNFKQDIGDETIVNWVQDLYRLTATGGIRMEWEDSRQLELPAGWLPIGVDMSGENLCLCLKKKGYGSVGVTVGYAEYQGIKPDVRRLAGSFSEFLDKCYDQEVLEPVDEVYDIASCGKKQDLLDYLRRGGKLTDKSRFGGNLIVTASALGNFEILRTCIEQGGEISRCLIAAVRTHKWDIMRYLVDAGADVNEVHPESGLTALQSIAGVWGKEREEVEQYLRSHGAKG